MLYLLYIEEMLDGDKVKCSNCKEFLYFSYVKFREASFRKLNSQIKAKMVLYKM